MSDVAKPKSNPPAAGVPKRTKSGQSAAVQGFRRKLESIQEGTYPVLEEINRQAEELKTETEDLKASIKPPEPAAGGDEEPKEDPES